MLRHIIPVCLAFFISSPSFAEDSCGDDASEANAAIAQARAEIDGGDSAVAVAEAMRALELAPNCFDAHLALTQAYNDRLGDVQGIAALPISRAFRNILAKTLALRPDNIEARVLQITYLYSAPRMAGGNRTQAEALLEELDQLDSRAANRVRIDIARKDGDNETLIKLLQNHPVTSVDELDERIQIVRSLIVETQNYKIADQEMNSWDNIELTERYQVERLFLRGALRVLGGYEYPEAEMFLTQFIERRPSLPVEAMEPTFVGQAFLGDALRLQGKTRSARETYEDVLRQDPKNDRAIRGLEALH